MHHPDIARIMLIIEDYFLLAPNSDTTYQLESFMGHGADGEHGLGIKVKRQLFNGCIEFVIASSNRDNDSVRFTYISNSDPDNRSKNFLISDNEYGADAVRATVKHILVLDKDAAVKQPCHH